MISQGAKSVGDTILCRKVVEPHSHMGKEVDEHNLRDVSVRESANDIPTTFLDYPNPVFDFTNMSRRGRCVQSCLGNMILDLLKFIIHENSLYPEACMCINIHNPM